VTEMTPKTTRILLVEDNPGDARLIREMLAESGEESFTIDWVSQLSQGLEKLARENFDVVLLDLGLPDSQGLETFSRAYARQPRLPFVVLTGLADEALGLSALRQGAQDYLIKGRVDGRLLCRAIRYAIERKQIQDALKAEKERLFFLLESLPAGVTLKAPDYSIRYANRFFRDIFGPWEGKRCFEVIFGAKESCEDCPSVKVLKTNQPLQEERTLPDRDRTYQVYIYPFHDTEGFPLVLSLAIDITARKQLEESLEASRRFLEISHRHSALTPLLEDFMAEIKRFTGCAAVGIRIMEDRGDIPFRVFSGLDLPACDLKSSWGAESGHFMCLKVIQGRVDPRMPFFTESGSFYSNHTSGLLATMSPTEKGKTCSLCNEFGFESVALVPVRLGPRIMGLLQAADPRQNLVTARKVEDLERAAVYLGTALEKLKAQESIHVLSQELLRAQEHERQRISRELHDSIAQELAALKITMENLRAELSERPELSQKLWQVSEKLQGTLNSVRNLSYILRPPDLEHLGLVQAIRRRCEEVAARTGLQIDFRAAGMEAVTLDYDTAINLYRIVREGLTNVERHARAAKANIRLVASFPKIILRLEDDGQGFEAIEPGVPTAPGKRMGLLGMKERVALLGGQMNIETQPNKGTKITVEIPWLRKP